LHCFGGFHQDDVLCRPFFAISSALSFLHITLTVITRICVCTSPAYSVTTLVTIQTEVFLYCMLVTERNCAENKSPITLPDSKFRVRFNCSTTVFRSRGSSVWCLATDWTTGLSSFDPRQRQEIFPLTSVSRWALGHTQPPVQWVLGVLSPGVKARPGRDADHSPPSSAEVVNE
jgi:hypothetical protein